MSQSVRRFHHQPAPLPVRAVGALGDAALALGLPLLPMEGDALRRAAERATGLQDWGTDFDEEPFERLLASAHDDAQLSFFGRLTLRNAVQRALAARLRLVEACRQHPEALAAPLRRPVVVLGLPRSGTTLLHHLLAAHPDAMFLPLWLAQNPLPAPSPAEWARGGSARRRRPARLMALATNWFSPELRRIHPMHTDLPVEDTHLQAPTFLSSQFAAWPLYSYMRWAEQADATPGYRCERRYLQLLQQSLPGDHWVLKSPGHLLALDACLEAFPEAQFVMTHRDPAVALASLTSLLVAAHGLLSHDRDPGRLFDISVRLFQKGLERYLVIREARPDRFLDVRFDELEQDALGVAERIFRRAGVRWDDEVRSALAAHLEGVRSRRAGPHRYALDAGGVDPAELRARFAPYLEAMELTAPR